MVKKGAGFGLLLGCLKRGSFGWLAGWLKGAV